MTADNILDRIIGATAYDPQGDKIGKIDQVYLDDETGKPVWATINTGLFGTSQSFAPLLRSHMKGDDVVLGIDKSAIKDAPRISDNGHLDDDETRRLYQYYQPHLQARDGRNDRMAGAGGRHDRDNDGRDDRAQRVMGDHDRDDDGVDDRRERGYDDRTRADRVMGRDDRDDRGTQYAGEGTGALGGAAAGAAAGGMAGGRRDHDRDNDGKDDRVQRVMGDHDRDNDGVDDRREPRPDDRGGRDGDGLGDNRIEDDRDRFGDRRDANYREDGESFGGLSERDYYDDRYEGVDRDRDRDMDRRGDDRDDRDRTVVAGQGGQQDDGRQRRLRRHAPLREVHEVKDAQGNVVERTVTEHLPDDDRR